MKVKTIQIKYTEIEADGEHRAELEWEVGGEVWTLVEADASTITEAMRASLLGRFSRTFMESLAETVPA